MYTITAIQAIEITDRHSSRREPSTEESVVLMMESVSLRILYTSILGNNICFSRLQLGVEVKKRVIIELIRRGFEVKSRVTDIEISW